MRRTKKRNIRASRRILENRLSIMLVTGVILVLALVISFAQVSLNAKNRAYKVQEAELQKQIKQEIVRSEEIDELEEYVGTDKYIEDVAKDKLGLVYPNEIMFEAEP
jgi:cell division protein DivIC